MILYIDIETEPNPDMVEYVTVPTPATVGDVPKNYKRKEAIDGWIAKEDAKRQAEYQGRLGKMALDVDYARITEIGLSIGDDGQIIAMQVGGDVTEADVLTAFWDAWNHTSRICGFNVLGFDLPIIIRRSFVLGIKSTCLIDLRKYSTRSVIDLMQLFYNWGNGPGPRARGLKAICQMYGIENALPDLDGSKMAEMDAETRRLYVINDVKMTRELADMMRVYYWG